MPKTPRCTEHTTRYQAGCPVCRAWANAYNHRRKKAIAAGTWKAERIPNETIRAHVRMLAETAGMSAAQVAAAARIEYGALTKLLYWKPGQWCRRATADAILAVRPHRPVDSYLVDPTGTRRRIQALGRVGWRQAEIAERAGAHEACVSKWLLCQRVTRATADVVRRVYADMSLSNGTSRSAELRAAKKGWLPPEAWSDTTIDDPAAQPYDWCNTLVDEVAVELVNAGRLPFGRLTKPERVELFRRFGDSAGRTMLCRRWGISTATLRQLERAANTEPAQAA